MSYNAEHIAKVSDLQKKLHETIYGNLHVLQKSLYN